MNNSFIALQNLSEEVPVENKRFLQKRAGELTDIVEALRAIRGSKHWKLLEEKVWSEVSQTLQKRLRSENNLQEINRLQGQIQWADKYLKLVEVEKAFTNELEIIKSQTNADTETNEN